MATIINESLKEESDQTIVVNFQEALTWTENESQGQPLRQSMHDSLVELRKSPEVDLGAQFELQKLFYPFIEVEFQLSDLPYAASPCPIHCFTLKTSETASRKPGLVKLRQDYIQFNVYSMVANPSNPDFSLRAYPLLPKSIVKPCKKLLEFVAACSIRGGSITPFVLPVLRMYEGPQYVYHVLSRTKFGTIGHIMRTLHIQRNGATDRKPLDSKIGCALPHQYILYYSACILQALHHLWDIGLSVNHLTTETVEVTDMQIPVLTDFLYASQCEQVEKHVLARCLPEVPGPNRGNLAWIAPELQETAPKKAQHGRVDVWNFGTFVLMMSVGTEGFKHVRDKVSEHRCHVNQTSTVIAMQPCSQLVTIRPCSIGTCSPELLHLFSVTLAEQPGCRPTFRILYYLNYFAKVRFLNLHEQVAAYGLNLGQLLGYSQPGYHRQSENAQKPQAAGSADSGNRRALQMKQQQMLEQMNDVDELLNRMGLQAVSVVERDLGK